MKSKRTLFFIYVYAWALALSATCIQFYRLCGVDKAYWLYHKLANSATSPHLPSVPLAIEVITQANVRHRATCSVCLLVVQSHTEYFIMYWSPESLTSHPPFLCVQFQRRELRSNLFASRSGAPEDYEKVYASLAEVNFSEWRSIPVCDYW